jgi:hypothetical protein
MCRAALGKNVAISKHAAPAYLPMMIAVATEGVGKSAPVNFPSVSRPL